MATNEITTKMSEQTQVNTTKADEPVQVTTKDPKKVSQGKKLAEWNKKIMKSWFSRIKLKRANLS